MKWYDWLTIFSLFFIVVALIIGTGAFYKDAVHQCTSNPLVYGAKELEKLYGFESVGSIYLITPIDTKTPTFVFNSENITRQQ